MHHILIGSVLSVPEHASSGRSKLSHSKCLLAARTIEEGHIVKEADGVVLCFTVKPEAGECVHVLNLCACCCIADTDRKKRPLVV